MPYKDNDDLNAFAAPIFVNLVADSFLLAVKLTHVI